MTIRPALREDLPRIWELILELADYEKLLHKVDGSLEQLERDFQQAFQSTVAVDGDEIIGYTLWFTNYSTFRTKPGIYLEDLYVSPSHRGKGIGKALLHDLFQRAEAKNYGRVEWSVLDWNQTAIDFYRSQGAEILEDWRICRVTIDSKTKF
jgi:GNAT superfamily N-acetyltransferase